MKHIIYLIYNLTTNTYYIGQTNNWIRRALEHHLKIPTYKRNSKWYYKKPKPYYDGNPYLIAADKLHNKITFTWLTICNSKSEANKAEVYWIQHFKDHNVNLYNKTCGGVYDSMFDVLFVDISRYPVPLLLPLDQVEKILKDPYLLRQDYLYYGLEELIRKVLLEQMRYN